MWMRMQLRRITIFPLKCVQLIVCCARTPPHIVWIECNVIKGIVKQSKKKCIEDKHYNWHIQSMVRRVTRDVDERTWVQSIYVHHDGMTRFAHATQLGYMNIKSVFTTHTHRAISKWSDLNFKYDAIVPVIDCVISSDNVNTINQSIITHHTCA